MRAARYIFAKVKILRISFLLAIVACTGGAFAQNLDSTKRGLGRGKMGIFFKRHFNGTKSYQRAEKETERLTFPFEDNNYRLVFYDNFDSLDRNKWGIGQPWGRFHGQQPHQYYGDSVVFTRGGRLHLLNTYQPQRFQYNADTLNIPYATGMVNTYNSKTFTYGYFAVRSKNPKGSATWPAFWLTGVHNWPPEIDIFEMYGKCDKGSIHTQTMSVHFGKIETNTKAMLMKSVRLTEDTDTAFHIYSCLWEPCQISFYTDGVLLATVKLNRYMRQFYREPMAMLLNNAVDHRYLDCLDNTMLPVDFQVDWVQVYQQVRREK